MVRIKKSPSKNVSIVDVARAAGVSITTVSRVINKFPSVKDKNRNKVLNAIKELKFQPSVLAQRLATGKSTVVALVIPRYEGIFYSFYALELLRGIGTLCAVFKLDLLLHLTDARTLLSMRDAGGFIFADVIGNRTQIDEVLARGVPCVVINHYLEDPRLSCIAIDNAGGAREATAYLASLGHRRIAHITGDLITQGACERLEGYKEALRSHKIPVDESLIIKTDYSRGQARAAAEQLLKRPEPPTAVFVASDAMALEVMAVAKEQGLAIPGDLSIVGFDDNPSGLYGPVGLTTVKQPLVKMAEESVKQLHSLMDDKKKGAVKKMRLPTELIVRESCRSLAG